MVETKTNAGRDSSSKAALGLGKESDGTMKHNPRGMVDVDTGWAWMVCFSCFVVNFIVDGLMFSFGVIQLKLLDHFEDGRSKTSWVGSTLIGAAMSMGPVVSILLEFYSCRQVMILGSLVSFCGFGLSVFAPNVETLVFTFGVLGGAGFGLTFLSSVLSVGLHFTTRRALSTGIATSGSGLGTLVISYITVRLLDVYGLQGTMLLIAGLVLNLFLCGVLVRPLVKKNTPLFPCCQRSKLFEDVTNHAVPCYEQDDCLQTPLVIQDSNPSQVYHQRTQIPNKTQSQELRKIDIVINSQERPRLARSIEQMLPMITVDRVYKSDCHLHKGSLQQDSHLDPVYTMSLLGVTSLKRKDICYSGSIFSLPECQRDSNIGSFLRLRSDISTEHTESAHKKKPFLHPYKALFGDKVFLMILFMMTSLTGVSTVLVYLPDMAVSKGLSRTNAALVVSMFGGTSIIGRLLAGFLANHPRIDSVALCTVALFLCSIISFAFPYCTSLWMFIVCSVIFGLSIAMGISLRTIVLADVLGISKLTTSFGLVAFFQGIVFTIGPPLSGALFDLTHSFTPPYILTAVIYGLGAVTCALIRPVQRWLDKSTINTGQEECFIGDKE